MADEKARTAVKLGVEKVKSHMDNKDSSFPYEIYNPYEWPGRKVGDNLDHQDSRILHAVEAAERAVLHAVEQEVDTLFHPKDRTEQSRRTGVQKMKNKVQQQHDHHRKWRVQEGEAGRIEDYIRFALE